MCFFVLLGRRVTTLTLSPSVEKNILLIYVWTCSRNPFRGSHTQEKSKMKARLVFIPFKKKITPFRMKKYEATGIKMNVISSAFISVLRVQSILGAFQHRIKELKKIYRAWNKGFKEKKNVKFIASRFATFHFAFSSIKVKIRLYFFLLHNLIKYRFLSPVSTLRTVITRWTFSITTNSHNVHFLVFLFVHRTDLWVDT